MGRLINTTSMTVDGVIDVSDWFVAGGDHDDAARALFETDGAARLAGRTSYEGFAGFSPPAPGSSRWGAPTTRPERCSGPTARHCWRDARATKASRASGRLRRVHG